MERDRIEFQSYLLEKLYSEFPGIVKALKECKHSSGDSFESQKHFHLEDSVWTHTMMVLQDAMHETVNWKIKMLLAICHDFGKPFSRTISEKNGNSRFIGHGQMGVQASLDYLLSIQRDNNWLTDSDIIRIIQVVCGHIEFLNIDLSVKIPGFCNNDIQLYNLYYSLAQSDNRGRIVSSEKIESYLVAIDKLAEITKTVYVNQFRKEEKKYQKNIILICGPSNVGKDTEARNLGIPTVSLDDARVMLFCESNPDHGLNSVERYDAAYEFCKNKKSLVNNKFFQMIKKQIEENDTIAICNTNCRRSTRRKIINSLKSHFRWQEIGFHCKYLVSESNRILSNAAKNQEKQISDSVLWKFMGYQNLPNLNEGFDSVEFILKR